MSVPFINAAVQHELCIQCPTCQSRHNIEWYVQSHLKENEKASSKHCGDCDTHFEFQIKDRNTVLIRTIPTTSWKGYMVVKQYEQPIYMVVETTFYDHHKTGQPNMDQTYWVDEHTCITNWLDVEIITEAGDTDPHGLFRFVRGMTFTQIKEQFGHDRKWLRDGGMDVDEAFCTIFPELLFTGNEPTAEEVEFDALIDELIEDIPAPTTLKATVNDRPTMHLVLKSGVVTRTVELRHATGSRLIANSDRVINDDILHLCEFIQTLIEDSNTTHMTDEKLVEFLNRRIQENPKAALYITAVKMEDSQ